MAVNPISIEAIDAYNRLLGLGMAAWEFDLLCRIDNAVIAVIAQQAPKPKGAETTQIPAENTAAIRDMFRGLAAQKAGKG